MRCSLCGYNFDPGDSTCAPACPMQQDCNLVCCPNCGYTMLDLAHSRTAGWLQRFLDGRAHRRRRRRGQQAHEGTSLLEWDVGRPAQVVAIRVGEPGRLARLSSLGLVPGSMVTVRQRQPAYIVQVGETEWAIDASIAAEIFVESVNES